VAYLSHDVVIASLFTSLGLKTNGIGYAGYPDFAAAVLVELWQKGQQGNDGTKNKADDFFVKVWGSK
jgi:hypothetical protein